MLGCQWEKRDAGNQGGIQTGTGAEVEGRNLGSVIGGDMLLGGDVLLGGQQQ